MKLRVVILSFVVLCFVAITHYSTTELTRFILVWNSSYGTTEIFTSDFIGELWLIWLTYLAGVTSFGFLAWKYIMTIIAKRGRG